MHLEEDSPARLLIVDDEPNIRSPIVLALSSSGYIVEEASSGREALDWLNNAIFDLILLDLYLPDFDGIELMRRIRTLCPNILVIILTGYPTLENAITAVKIEAVDYLCKPTSLKDISRAVNRALEKQIGDLYEQYPQLSPSNTKTGSPPNSTYRKLSRILCAHPLKLDRVKQLAIVENNPGHAIELTKGETAILASLMARPNKVFSCQQLASSAWGYELAERQAQSVVRPYISRLRRKFQAVVTGSRLIRTVRKRGYHFVTTTTPAETKKS